MMIWENMKRRSNFIKMHWLCANKFLMVKSTKMWLTALIIWAQSRTVWDNMKELSLIIINLWILENKFLELTINWWLNAKIILAWLIII